MPAMLHVRPTLSGHVQAAYDGVETILQIQKDGKGHMPGMRSGPGGWFPDSARPDPAYNQKGALVIIHPLPADPKIY